MWQVVHILSPMSCCAATVQHGLQRQVVAVTFSGFATSTAPVIPSASLVGSFGGFEELCAFASRLCRVVAIADDL